MGDYYTILVPKGDNVKNPEQTAKKGVDWLINSGIIKPIKTECVLGGIVGYQPSRNIKNIFERKISEEDLNSYLELKTNGLEIITKRTVFYVDGGMLDSIICPNCKANILDGDWAEFLDNWQDGGSEYMICDNCNHPNNISSYLFLSGDENWLFSNLGFKFWNLPNVYFQESFITDLENIISRNMAFISGKL